MEWARLIPAGPEQIDEAARQSGELAVGCTDAAGRVEVAVESIRTRIGLLRDVRHVFAGLKTDQERVARAIDEASRSSADAREHLRHGAGAIDAAAGDLAAMAALVSRLGVKVERFLAAMAQVSTITGAIQDIARTTKMLALNAAIEAERAGDAGRAFAVVASEVKSLSRDTSAATAAIQVTMASLSAEANAFVSEVASGCEHSAAARESLKALNGAGLHLGKLFDRIDRQVGEIALATDRVQAKVTQVDGDLQVVARHAASDADLLAETRNKVLAMEARSQVMFNSLVQIGFGQSDRPFIELAIEQGVHFARLAEDAIDAGFATIDQLFDRRYQVIPGSNPERFRCGQNAFADRTWRPELERLLTSAPQVISAACTDVNGYLPTVISKYDRPPTGDPDHDGRWCRHGSIFMDETDRLAKASTAPFFLSAYRRQAANGGFAVARNVSVPLFIKGRRWGDFECSYSC